MKLLTDFDGVLTDLEEEALRVREIFLHKIFSLGESALPRSDIQSFLDHTETEIDRYPFQHGWRSENRISAYAKEDHFVYNNAWGEYLDQVAKTTGTRNEGQTARTLLQAIQKEFPSFTALAQNAFQTMAKESFTGNFLPIDATTSNALQRILDRGHEIVVVSNSGTERILKMLSGAGLKPVAHDENPKSKFRVRGGANKFVLGSKATPFEVDSISFDIARPHYDLIIREEKPDIAVGDVFSLDLSLPLWLSTHREGFLPNPTLCLRERSYTPSWAKAIFNKPAPQGSRASLKVLNDFSDLLDVLH